MRAPASLRGRIAVAAVAAVALVGVVTGVVLLAAIERDGREAVDRSLRERAPAVTRAAIGPGRGGPRDERGHEDALLAGAGTFVQVALRGEVVVRRGDVPAEAPPVPAGDGLSTVHIDGEPWRSLAFSGGRTGELRIQVLTSLASVQARVARIRRLVIGLGISALALTGLAAWLFTGLAVRPLDRLRTGAARVGGADDLATPLAEDDGPEEVRSLARALNEMLGRLRASSEATRRFAADAGHELRTPLTGLRANLDALERNPGLPEDERAALVRQTIAEQERVVHLLEGLQALARGEAADHLPREDSELGDLVDAALFEARRRHPQTAFELAEPVEEAVVRGWPGGLRLIADNLLDNAALHGRPGGRVRVGLGSEDGSAILRVEDDGPGIPEDERERVLEPFARGSAASAPGTGLGLAIVAQQAALHGGALRLDGSPLGGLRAEVRLPVTGA